MIRMMTDQSDDQSDDDLDDKRLDHDLGGLKLVLEAKRLEFDYMYDQCTESICL